MARRRNEQVSQLEQDYAAMLREKSEKEKERGDVDEIKNQIDYIRAQIEDVRKDREALFRQH